MKALVVYYSRSGNTKKVAVEISNALKCDIEEIKDKKNRKGIIGWLMAGRDATLGKITKIDDIFKEVSSYDLIIIGGPIWSWNVIPPVKTFLLQYMEQFKNVAFFCTEGSSGADRCFTNMEKVCGKKPIATLAIKEDEIKSEKHREKVSEFVDKIRSSK